MTARSFFAPAVASLVLLSALAATPDARAAEIRYLGANSSDIDRQFVDPALPCNLSLTGPIEKGDADRLAPLLADSRPGERNFEEMDLLCLDSPGGSFTEALKIVALVKNGPVGTRIEEDRRCESACALIFMAGAFHAHESGFYKWRVMHPRATLGFHAPSLIVENGVYDANSVQRSYDVALRTVAQTASQLMLGGRSEDGDFMKVSLLAEMLSTPASSMLHVDTVDQAGRWDIDVGPLEPVALDDARFRIACMNQTAWQRDQSSVGTLQEWLVDAPVVRKSENGVVTGVTFIHEEMNGIGCEFMPHDGIVTSAGIRNAKMTFGQIYEVKALDFMAPETRLSTLRVAAPAAPQPPVAAVPQPQALPGATGECVVLEKGVFLDRDPCRLEQRRVKGAEVANYHWPSGAKTVIEARGGGWFINGQRTFPRPDISGRGTCATNYSTGRDFCYTPNG